MTYREADTSVSDAQPVRLYQLDRSATVVWRYTSADREIQFNGQAWSPVAISDDGIRLTGEASADVLSLTLPAKLPVAQLYRSVPPSDEIFLTIYDYDATAMAAKVAWIGSVNSVSWPRVDTAKLACLTLSASMKRDGLRLRYERACPHSVYDDECGANKAQFSVSATVVALDGSSVQVALSKPVDASIFAYGAICWAVDGSYEFRGIEGLNGTRMNVVGGTDGLEVDQAVEVFPGCDGTRQTCLDRFANLLNHGGFPHMPGKSIYSGERLW